MFEIGFPVSAKDGEKRRALLPVDITRIAHPGCLFFEQGYGAPLGISDDAYIQAGAHVASREEVLSKPVICEPKAGDADYLGELQGKTVFGWIHAVQNRDICDALTSGGNTVYAWEDMYGEDGVHTFHMNNRIAGKAALKHACECCGICLEGKEVAVLGRGNCACGAIEYINSQGGTAVQFLRNQEKEFNRRLPEFGIIVNAIKWDPMRKDHIIYREDLARMQQGTLIVDISCDRHGGIETSESTSISNPTYIVDGIIHYAVDNTPSLLYEEATAAISHVLPPFLNHLAEGTRCKELDDALIIREGVISDRKIIDFQKGQGAL